MLRRPGAICQCSNGRLLLMNNIAAPFVQQLPAKWEQGRATTASPLPTPGDGQWPRDLAATRSLWP